MGAQRGLSPRLEWRWACQLESGDKGYSDSQEEQRKEHRRLRGQYVKALSRNLEELMEFHWVKVKGRGWRKTTEVR